VSASQLRLRKAGDGDATNLDAFLGEYPETSMFLRGNLASHGLGVSNHRHSTTYWLYESQCIEAVVACTKGGYLMCQAPNGDAAFWDAAAAVLMGRKIAGITGVPNQVDAWVNALGLERAVFSVKETEPLYRLALEDLQLPQLTGLQLRKPTEADKVVLEDWFDGYAQDTGITPTDGASGDVAAAVFAAHDAARILERDGVAVAMTSLNARVAETVQIGGVYVPTALRGQGLAGAVVAAQLFELRTMGTTTAILFAANAAAARAYERIGFQRVGDYEIALLKTPFEVKGSHDVFQT
jgi:RimJ/RimL family protein N-acetyltransferase